MEKIRAFINGCFFEQEPFEWIENFEPATGKVYSHIANCGASEVNEAVKAAQNAFEAWSSSPRSFRSQCLNRLADLIEGQLPEFAKAESKDNGKPLQVSLSVDIPRAISNLRFFATAILHQESQSHDFDQDAINYTLRQPIGVVGCISPWNLPLYLFTWKVAPALAAGNTLVSKPSEITPYTAYLLSRLIGEAGFPPGVFNIVHGTGPSCGEAIVKHPNIKAISFTGGTATGKRIAAIAAPMFKKLSLELGGKNPTLVFADCDFEHTVNEVIRASFSNQGQICLCGSRILVQESVYEQFKNAFVAKVQQLKVGQPFDEQTQVGALVSKTQLEKVQYYVNLAKEEGGRILCGGQTAQLSEPFDRGYYFQPTVIEGLSNTCRVNQEEIFGPVVTLQSFTDEMHALSLANGTGYGLAASVWTTNLKTAHKLAERLEMGIVWINCWMLRDLRTPFGGVKNSGIGREGGWEALRFFTEAKNVCIKK
jgi:aminomuconate-semialdehyde/2-hydroxymuconate-6-semialdehyde dehydrogenase